MLLVLAILTGSIELAADLVPTDTDDWFRPAAAIATFVDLFDRYERREPVLDLPLLDATRWDRERLAELAARCREWLDVDSGEDDAEGHEAP
jgi:hypothetical protein